MEPRLGRGLGSLLSQTPTGSGGSAGQQLPLDQIRPNPYQPRERFDPQGLEELESSIRQHGVIQPIAVRRSQEGYQIISGERRWRAAQAAGLTAIPAVIRENVEDEQMLELALVENLQRRDLDPIERARGYQQMQERLSLTQEAVAQRVGLRRSTVTNHLRLLELPDPIQEALVHGLISMGHARALLGMGDPTEQLTLTEAIARDGLSVRDVELRVREATRGDRKSPTALESKPKSQGSKPGAEPWVKTLQERLQSALGTSVELHHQGGYKGSIQIRFFDQADLERLLQQLAPKSEL
jgi:ParB family chromosome partitioning protein